VLGHLLVPLLLLPNRLPWLVLGLICLLLAVHGYWQWQLLARRSGTLTLDSGGLFYDWGAGAPVAVTGRIRYLSRWLLVLELEFAKRRQRLALWRDGYSAEDWRQLQVLARDRSRRVPGLR